MTDAIQPSLVSCGFHVTHDTRVESATFGGNHWKYDCWALCGRYFEECPLGDDGGYVLYLYILIRLLVRTRNFSEFNWVLWAFRTAPTYSKALPPLSLRLA
jgi:hypothetical protein